VVWCGVVLSADAELFNLKHEYSCWRQYITVTDWFDSWREQCAAKPRPPLPPPALALALRSASSVSTSASASAAASGVGGMAARAYGASSEGYALHKKAEESVVLYDAALKKWKTENLYVRSSFFFVFPSQPFPFV
jgi:hypothetical protein